VKHGLPFEEPDMGSLLAPFSIEAFDPGQVILPLIAFPVVKLALLGSSHDLPHRPHVSCLYLYLSFSGNSLTSDTCP
jgi:hypothetical protein